MVDYYTDEGVAGRPVTFDPVAEDNDSEYITITTAPLGVAPLWATNINGTITFTYGANTQ